MAGQNGGRTGRRWGNDQNGGDDARALALKNEAQPPRLPVPTDELARELAISRPMWKLLTDTVYPAAKTVDGIMQAVAYCKARGLDVMKKPVHVVPMWNSQLGREVETVWPGIGELRTTAARTGQWAGTEDVVFGPTKNQAFQDEMERDGRNGKYVKKEACDAFDFPLWAQVTVKKIVAGQVVTFVGPKVLFFETFAGMGGLNVPNAMWRKRPFGQLEKCAEAAALRRAFPEEIGEQYAAEEMEGKEWIGHNGGPALDEAGGGGVVVEAKREAAPTRASSAEADRKRAADERFVENTRNGLSEADPAQLDRAWKADAERIANLDEDLHTTIVGLYDDARRRLGMEVPLTDEDIAGYKTEFRRQLKTKQSLDEVTAFLQKEADNLDALPEADQDELDVDVDEHRDNIAALAEDSTAGQAAPPAEEETQGPEEP